MNAKKPQKRDDFGWFHMLLSLSSQRHPKTKERTLDPQHWRRTPDLLAKEVVSGVGPKQQVGSGTGGEVKGQEGR